jgi:HK97 family phage prohead protease
VKLAGHAAVFGAWTTIDSAREGRFREMVAPGAFKKTIAENRDRVRVLLSHGHDPQLGDRPLGPLEELREDPRGLWYSVPLLDGVPELVTSGLRAGLYGASFRFAAVREEFTQRPARSEANPDRLPERVLKEVKLFELGPCTWPAYQGATAGVRATGETLELRAVGREEVFPSGLGSGSTPGTIRRLRRDGSAHARELLRALERGETVSLTWGGGIEVRGHIVGGAKREASWRLPSRGETRRLNRREPEPTWRL